MRHVDKNLRPAYRNDSATCVRDGEAFTIVGFDMGEVGGDHPEPMFTIEFACGFILEDVQAEMLFVGYDTLFDRWCEANPDGGSLRVVPQVATMNVPDLANWYTTSAVGVYVLHDDGSEALIESALDLVSHVLDGRTIAVEQAQT